MKKLILAALAGLMLIAYVPAASAEVTVGGTIEVRYGLWSGLDLNRNANDYDTQNFFDQRVTLSVDAKIAEGLSALVELDTENYDWGQETEHGNIPTYLNHEKPALSIRQAWINFMIPGMPVGIKIGHQPLKLGHGIWLDTSRRGSDAILIYAVPTDSLLIAAAYVQMSQDPRASLPGMGFNSAFSRLGVASILAPGTAVNGPNAGPNAMLKDDADAYAALINFTISEGNSIGTSITYVDDDTSLDDVLGLRTHIRAYNFMLYADGSIADMVNFKAELDWLYINSADRYAPDMDYIVSAFAAMAGVNVDIAKIMNVGMEVAYGTGNDGTGDAPNLYYSPGNVTWNPGGNRHDHAYYTPYNSTSYNYAYPYNDKIGQGPLGTGGGLGYSDGFGGFGLANTGYVKLSVGVTPTDRMDIGLDLLCLNASEQLVKGQSRYLGTEVDAHMDYKIYDNLTLGLQAGYFFAGDWYEFGDEVDATLLDNPEIAEDPLSTATSLKTDNAYGMEATLKVDF